MDNLEVHRPGDLGRGAALGGLGGSILGVLVGAVTYKPCTNCFLDFGQGFDMLVGAIVGFLPGLGIGMIIGGRKNRFAINRTKQNFDGMRSRLFRLYGHRTNKE